MSLVNINQLSFSYQGLQILNNINLTIFPSDFILLEGSSGQGKSTFCQILSGYLKPTSGTIELNGELITHPSRSILYLPQDDDLFEWHSLRQHFQFLSNLPNCKNENTALLTMLGLTDCLHKLPKELSAGQKKKAQIYKSYILHPKMVIFDETFSSIDQDTTNNILSHMIPLWKSSHQTVLFVSHYSQNIKPHAGRVLKIQNTALSELNI